jgi:hypothetical protein
VSGVRLNVDIASIGLVSGIRFNLDIAGIRLVTASYTVNIPVA